MKTLTPEVANEIKAELESLPEKYANTDFNSTHEGLAVIQEEFEELKHEVFFGEKKAAQATRPVSVLEYRTQEDVDNDITSLHKKKTSPRSHPDSGHVCKVYPGINIKQE